MARIRVIAALVRGKSRAGSGSEENEGLFAGFPVCVDVQVSLLKD